MGILSFDETVKVLLDAGERINETGTGCTCFKMVNVRKRAITVGWNGANQPQRTSETLVSSSPSPLEGASA